MTKRSPVEYLRAFLKNKAGATAALLFLALTAWRVGLIFYVTNAREYSNQIWAATYQLMALWGVICGIVFSRYWGNWKSVMGRANLAFALGLCMQLFGQSVFSWYFYTGINTPYPSLADIGFFGSIPFYIYGAILLIKASGGNVSLRFVGNKILAIIIPLILLGGSYYFFLVGYQFDWTQPVKIFLDFGYPLGQALYISCGILAFILSMKMLGGVMKWPIMLFIIALVAQYASDFTFLYQSSRGTFVGGGIDDYLYLVGYFLMAASLIQLAITYKHIKNS